MKKQKTMSLLCALAMSLTLVLPVGAVHAIDMDGLVSPSSPVDPISEFADQSVVCQAFSQVGDELTSRLVTVYIPAGTTLSEEAALLIAATSGQQRQSARAVDIISTMRDITITTSSTNVGGGTALSNYASIHVDVLGGNTDISVHCRNNTTGDQSPWADLDIEKVAQTVVFITKDVRVSKDNNITVNARTNMGTAHTTICMVQGSTV